MCEGIDEDNLIRISEDKAWIYKNG
jgi:hypothetical protein